MSKQLKKKISFEILSFHYLTTSEQLVEKQGAKPRETGREQNFRAGPGSCMAHFVPHYPGGPACSSSHWLESDGAVLCKP